MNDGDDYKLDRRVVSDGYQHYSQGQVNDKCVPITIPLCTDIPYNMTIYPNLLNHQKQDDAGMEVHQFFPLVKVKCSDDLKFFLCTMYAPVCTVLGRALPPCRHLCQSAKSGCENLMNKFGFKWPETLACEQFPESGLCVGENRTASTPMPRPPSPAVGEDRPLQLANKFPCPSSMQVTTKDSTAYSLTFGNETVEQCSFPCNAEAAKPVRCSVCLQLFIGIMRVFVQLFFEKVERRFLRLWIGFWAIACAASTLFTVLTFFVDMGRFPYPVRPIFFLAVCYLFISIVYIVGFVAEERVSCAVPPGPIGGQSVLNTLPDKLVTQGTRNISCTILAMLHYYFGVASSIWWVVLCFAWFLAANLKWGQESIEAQSPYFHFFAWGVPALLVIGVLITGSIDGDVYSGICSVGNWNGTALRHFVLIPLGICLGSFRFSLNLNLHC